MTTELHEAVRAIIEYAGGDPNDPDLKDTPRRYLDALAEMTGGRHENIAGIMASQFPCKSCGLVEAAGIRFSSLCPHHLLPYTGTVVIRYRPAGRVVGLSKLARLVDTLAHRLILQERLAADIADAVMRHLEPHGVEVVVRARHGCVSCRGVRQAGMRVKATARRGSTEKVTRG
jgi:GTP cyclohydrolase I